MRSLFLLSLMLGAVLTFPGCGYVLLTSKSPILEKEGVRRVYVKPLTNNTFKPGVENVVYNALVRTLLAHRRVELVQDEKDADAVLQGTINFAQFGISAPTNASNIAPPNFPAGLVPSVTVPSIYSAVLGCDFSLVRSSPKRGRTTLIWGQSFSRSKPFPSSNQLDVPGTTSALINESEFERAISEIATIMVDDVHDSMLSMF